MKHLWVKETWAAEKEFDISAPIEIPNGSKIWYLADGTKPDWCGKTRPSIFMVRWMSRITLEITGVRVDRLNAISEADASAEGVSIGPIVKWKDATDAASGWRTTRDEFQILWDSINAKRDGGIYAWDKNPWVWVIQFRKL